jgi:serine/threonine-protein kinase HipA
MPEGHFLNNIINHSRINISDFYTFFYNFGFECAGALNIIPENQINQKFTSEYFDITDKIFNLLDKPLNDIPNLITTTNSRTLLAGGQNKLAVNFFNDRIFIPAEDSNAPTEFIIKLNAKDFHNTVFNELFCISLAKSLDFNVPETSYLKIAQQDVLVSKRFDRIFVDNKFTRLHQLDFCQELGLSNHSKYQDSSSITFYRCLELYQYFSRHQQETFILDMINIFIFNFIIGNCDAHGKNYSLLYDYNAFFSKDLNIKLSPFYDLISTVIYPGLSTTMALGLGDDLDVNNFSPDNWMRLIKISGIGKNILFETILTMCNNIKTNLELLTNQFIAQYANEEFFTMLNLAINSRADKSIILAEKALKTSSLGFY